MNVNIEQLSVSELLALNKRIARRLKELNLHKQASAVLKFRMGDIVSFFRTADKTKITGFIISIRKTKINILTETGAQWMVSAAILTPEENASKKLLKLRETFFPRTLPLKFSARK